MLKGNLARLVELNGSGTDRPGWATTPMEYADFMIDAFEAWREGAYRHFLIEPLASLIKVVSGSVPSFCHFTEAKCAFVVTLYPDGRIGSCDELRMPDAELARIDDVRDLDELLHYRTNPTLDRSLARLFEKCNECSYRTTCRGGCLATRLQFEGTPYDDEYCAHRARLVDFVSAQLAGSNTSTAL